MDTAFAQRRRRDLIIAACCAVLAALVPLFVKDVYVQNIMVLTLMYAALSQSWNILSGYCGQISLGPRAVFRAWRLHHRVVVHEVRGAAVVRHARAAD